MKTNVVEQKTKRQININTVIASWGFFKLFLNNNQVTCRATSILILRINMWKQREQIKKNAKKAQWG